MTTGEWLINGILASNAALAAAKGTLVSGDGTRYVETVVGSDGKTLVADSTQTGGVKWIANTPIQTQHAEIHPSVDLKTTSATYQSTGLSCSNTPNFSTSKILIQVSGGLPQNEAAGGCLMHVTIKRGGTDIAPDTSWGMELFVNPGAGAGWYGPHNITWLDSPSTTSATTYEVFFKSSDGVGQIVFSRNASIPLPITMTLTEIAQ